MDYLGKDGRKIFASLSASLLRDERGEVTGSLGIIRDITEFRVLSQQLLQSERLATIATERALVEATATALDARWAAERELVDKIQAIRGKM